jgi:hypothetical protein
VIPNTVAKWKKRDYVHDSKMGPNVIKSTVLTAEEEETCVTFRKSTLLPLDDCLFALRETIPNLSRSSPHRLFQRNGISQLPKPESKSEYGKFKAYPVGFFHIDITEIRAAEGKLFLFVAIDRTSKLVYGELTKKIVTNKSCDKKALMHISDRICIENTDLQR